MKYYVQLDADGNITSLFYTNDGSPRQALEVSEDFFNSLPTDIYYDDGTLKYNLQGTELSVNPAPIVMSQSSSVQVMDINTLLPQIIDYVVSGDTIPQTLKSQWQQARGS